MYFVFEFLEIIRAGPNGHDLAVDWWSVGVLTYELLTGASPFTVVEQQNSQSDISRRIQKVDPVLPSTLGETVKDFILKMLHKDPKKRLGKLLLANKVVYFPKRSD